MMNKLMFEELEVNEELGNVSDFAGAAAPWVAIAVTVAIFAAT